MPQSIAYLMSRFPHLSETFILREMNELVHQGWQISLYPLMVQQQNIIHDEARQWVPQAKQTPWLSGAMLKSLYTTMGKQPNTFAKILGQTTIGYVSRPNELIRAVALLPKAVHMAQTMQRESIAHIHAHYATYPALVAWIIHRLTGISYSITVHAHDIYVSQAMLARKLRSASFIVAISDYNKRFLQRHAGLDITAKTEVIHCGIQPDQYKNTQTSNQKAPWNILSTGSLQEYKGFPYLIKACAILQEQGLDFQCRVIGGGEQQAELQALMTTYNLQERFTLLGSQPEHRVRELLAEADCYVQPSIITAEGKMEGIPVALMEALATQLPVVATDISGISELIKPNQTGILVAPADPTALAQALRILYDNPQTAAVYAQAGQEYVKQEFNLEKNVSHLARLLRRVAPQAAPPAMEEGL